VSTRSNIVTALGATHSNKAGDLGDTQVPVGYQRNLPKLLSDLPRRPRVLVAPGGSWRSVGLRYLSDSDVTASR